MKKYFEEIVIVESEVKNISHIIDNQNKLCRLSGPIKIPSDDNTIEILHIVSTKCKACIEDSEAWQDFPYKLYESMGNKREKIRIINLIDNLSFQSTEWQGVMAKLINRTLDNNSFTEKLAEKNIEICSGVINQNILQRMRLNIFPSTIVLKNMEIIYVSYGPMDGKDIKNLTNSLLSIS
jgi:hypothetical protein